MMHFVSCLCERSFQEVNEPLTAASGTVNLSLCHCDTCRHTTGLLCTSYLPIQEPSISDKLSVFNLSERSSRYFCSTCGCHLFRSLKDDRGVWRWGAATGAIVSSDLNISPIIKYTAHTNLTDTKDGGASIWLPLDGKESWLETPHNATAESTTSTSLEASCACGSLRLRITRPNEASTRPHRSFPDLTHAYCYTDYFIRRNPSDEKWWIQGAKYRAGTCACRSCRLVSGFEIQTWAFVPRANISIHTPGSDTETEIPLDFDALPVGVLQSYDSSPGAIRDFCGKCGATVFWRNRSDSSVVDVSVGLLRATDGARAESWLKWWPERVSFSEEAQVQREGTFAVAAQGLIDALAQGLRAESARRSSQVEL